MPAKIIKGFISFIETSLGVSCWDGEVPLYDVSGNPINPSANATNPVSWPVIRLFMEKPGFQREHTMADPYDEVGTLVCQVYAITRDDEENTLNDLEAKLVLASNWPLIVLGGPAENPYYVVKVVIKTWYSGQEEGVRTADAQYVYLGQLDLEVMTHGIISSFL